MGVANWINAIVVTHLPRRPEKGGEFGSLAPWPSCLIYFFLAQCLQLTLTPTTWKLLCWFVHQVNNATLMGCFKFNLFLFPVSFSLCWHSALRRVFMHSHNWSCISFRADFSISEARRKIFFLISPGCLWPHHCLSSFKFISKILKLIFAVTSLLLLRVVVSTSWEIVLEDEWGVLRRNISVSNLKNIYFSCFRPARKS